MAAAVPFTITVLVGDVTTGESTIESAEYKQVNDVGDIVASGAVLAVDEPFESVTEEVIATVSQPVGIYDACVRGTDAAGNIGEWACTLLDVYDPTAGFVTGAGFIDFPLGACVADPTLTGAANFSFASRYKKGADTPDGHTKFHFRAGGLISSRPPTTERPFDVFWCVAWCR